MNKMKLEMNEISCNMDHFELSNPPVVFEVVINMKQMFIDLKNEVLLQ